jgi:cytidyltransferase-like protein
MGFGVIGYVVSDGVDGIHARKTKQTSIIGEYLVHLVDLNVMGIVLTYSLKMFGLDDIFYNNLFLLLASIEFTITHFNSIFTKKIIFSGLSDVSLVTTLTYLVIFFNKKLPDFLLKNQWIILILLLVPTLKNINKIIKVHKSNLSVEEKYFKNIYLLYWLLRFVLTIFNQTSMYWSWIIIDLLITIETINLKIFQSQLLNQYMVLTLPFIHTILPTISNLIVLTYLGYFIHSISKQLNINLMFNSPSVYLPRVYCCGVFDMCHLGHMKLFEKISKSFDYPIWLIIGVHSDSTVKSYKREPIINETLRVETVSLCKYVDEVLPEAELVVTKEFCLEHKIDCVIIGEEYKDNKDKIWYIGGMELGIHKYISRFDPISTTDIIKKVKLYE